MSSAMKRLGIDAWSVEDRLQLIGDIWDSLEAPLDLSDAHREELDRRLDAADSDPSGGLPWEEVRRRLLARE